MSQPEGARGGPGGDRKRDRRERTRHGLRACALARFAEHGFDDIVWAFPVILGRLSEVAELAGRIVAIDETRAITTFK